MSDIIIKGDGVGKKYFIGHERAERYTAMRDVIVQNLKGMGRKFQRLFSEAGASVSGDYIEEFWALKDLDFEIKQGDAVGVIGRNGAGKSTLLKVLSRITTPSAGRIEINGRMSSLLEVGTGFHPELTGRENIFLNGAIIGMSRGEIKRKFDEIVDFSGVEQFLDTPVKRYSSGMYVRLAFSVAAHLESEILVVDEVLAVGDAAFQKKCLGKMDEVSHKQGRTVLFVSHNMQAMSSLCNTGILLNRGRLELAGNIDNCINNYFKQSKVFDLNVNTALSDRLNRTTGKVRFDSIEIIKAEGADDIWSFTNEDEIGLSFRCVCFEKVEGLIFYLAIKSQLTDTILTNFRTKITSKTILPGEEVSFSISLPGGNIRPGQFDLYFALADSSLREWYDVVDHNVSLPSLIVTSTKIDVHENAGFCSLPFRLKSFQ